MSDEQAWRMIEELPGPAGFLDVRARRYRMPDGSVADWDILHGGPTVAVLALSSEGDVIMVEQYRPGPERMLLELPGGVVEPGEDILTAAVRELHEETGYTAGTAEIVGKTWLASYASHQRYAVLAFDCTLSASRAPRQEGEFCETILLPYEKFLDHVRSGELTDTDIAFICIDSIQSRASVARG